MMHQRLTYASAPQRARIKAPVRNEVIPVVAMMTSIGLAVCTPGVAQARPVGSGYVPQTNTSLMSSAREEDISPFIALTEIKKTTGLTWTQIAGLLGVTRKSIDNWMNGAPVRGGNLNKIGRLLDRVRGMVDLPRFKIRTALLGPTAQPKTRDGRGPLIVSDNTPPRHRPKKLAGPMTMG
jgi:hypothetical protein